MAKKLDILIFPDPRLRKVAEKVTKFDKCLEKLAQDMLETMYEANGIGLAATQVDKHIRLVVMDLSEERNDPRIFVNPEYEILEGYEMFEFEEGCLSDTPEGILTVCIQHEIDHLDGKLMVDYVSALKRDRIRNKLLKDFR